MYTAQLIKNVDNGKGCWNSQLIGIFDTISDIENNKVGEFKRNYPSYGVSTFAPFKFDDQWYALYSESYTEIALMELPSCKKITSCGGGSMGFCPVEIWVPAFKEVVYNMKGGIRHDGSTWEAYTYKHRFYDNQSWGGDEEFVPEDYEIQYENFALVSGCVWGDDSSWKVVAVDLSKLKRKRFKKIELKQPFGYIELAQNSKLRDIKINCEMRDMPQDKDVPVRWEYTFNIPTQQRFYWMDGINDKQFEKYDSTKRIDFLAQEDEK